MLVVEGTPETILRSFHEGGLFEEVVLCVFASNRLSEAEIIKSFLSDVLAVDAVLANKVAFLILSNDLSKLVRTERHNNETLILPAILPKNTSRARKAAIRDLEHDFAHPKEELDKLLYDHRRYSEEFCEHLGLDLKKMPYAIFSVRGVTEPFAVKLPISIDKSMLSNFLAELSNLIERIYFHMCRRDFAEEKQSAIISDVTYKEGLIRSLCEECRQQIQKTSLHVGLSVEAQEILIVQAQNGRFSIKCLEATTLSEDEISKVRSNQGFLKAERKSKEIYEAKRGLEEGLKFQIDILDATLRYFRTIDGVSSGFERDIQEMAARLTRDIPGSAMQTVGNFEKRAKMFDSLLSMTRRIISWPM